jgi:hypothetical protein
MPVYVDDMRRRKDVPNGKGVVRGNWSHLMADTHEELVAAARQLGLKEEWIQDAGTGREHFDLVETKRTSAIEMGAVQITYPRGVAELLDRKRSAERAPAIQAELNKGHKPVSSFLLVTGPRKGVSKETVADALRPHYSPEVMLVAGGAPGVDRHAAELWREWGGVVEEHKVTRAEWDANPKGAGFARNGRMVQRLATSENGKVLAIDLPCTKEECAGAERHNTHGTSQCAELADRAGLAVEHYPVDPGREAAFAELDKGLADSQQARDLDRQAGEAYGRGDYHKALNLLGEVRVLDPGLPDLADHFQRVRTAERAAVAKTAEPRDMAELADTFAERLGPQRQYEHERDANRGEPTEPCDAPRGEAHCGELGHLYPAGRRCDEHRPKQIELTDIEPGK